MEVLKTEDALKEYGTNNGVIKITVDPSKKGQELPKHNIYIDGKKATSEEVAALPPNPKVTLQKMVQYGLLLKTDLRRKP